VQQYEMILTLKLQKNSLSKPSVSIARLYKWTHKIIDFSYSQFMLVNKTPIITAIEKVKLEL